MRFRIAEHELKTVETKAAIIKMAPPGLYVHVPWCVAKCPYCDFNSHVLRGELPQEDYRAALLADLDFELAHRPASGPLHSVFFGGGTPSLLAPETVAALLDTFRGRLDLEADVEITLEANPGTIERGRFAEYRAAGINRFSLGVQSFDDAMLHRLGRIHSAREAWAAAEELHAAGAENFNLDLMHGLPGQDAAGALADIGSAVALAPAHLSWYELTLEPGTAFYRRPPVLPPEDDLAVIEDAGCAEIAAAGYARYEVSAYARPGRECRHNDNYWRYGDYIGIGPGAHGKRSGAAGIVRTARIRSPARWQRLAGRAEALSVREIPPMERPFEFLLGALRRTDGFTWSEFEARTGCPRESVGEPVAEAQADGLLEIDSRGGIRASTWGFRYLNELQSRFLPEAGVSKGLDAIF
ncbi:MAG: radical SAM family heme chaperone HemW [Gammaproteobacteria bacterium]